MTYRLLLRALALALVAPDSAAPAFGATDPEAKGRARQRPAPAGRRPGLGRRVGFNGRTEWATPNLDRLATRRDDLQCGSTPPPSSVPEPGGLMTGRYDHPQRGLAEQSTTSRPAR